MVRPSILSGWPEETGRHEPRWRTGESDAGRVAKGRGPAGEDWRDVHQGRNGAGLPVLVEVLGVEAAILLRGTWEAGHGLGGSGPGRERDGSARLLVITGGRRVELRG